MTVGDTLLRLIGLIFLVVPMAVTTYMLVQQQQSHLPYVDAVLYGVNSTCVLTHKQSIYGAGCPRNYNGHYCRIGWLARYTFSTKEYTQPEVYFEYPELNGLNLAQYNISDPIVCYSQNFSDPDEVVAIQEARKFPIPEYAFVPPLFGTWHSAYSLRL
jgi:hypothetical protein